jgi:hypothetical protein
MRRLQSSFKGIFFSFLFSQKDGRFITLATKIAKPVYARQLFPANQSLVFKGRQ